MSHVNSGYIKVVESWLVTVRKSTTCLLIFWAVGVKISSINDKQSMATCAMFGSEGKEQLSAA